MGERDYRVFSSGAPASKRASLLHLVREDAEASLCGIPRIALADAVPDQLVCSECIDWLLKRRSVSGQHRRPDVR
jgi:hypothetical protein